MRYLSATLPQITLYGQIQCDGHLDNVTFTFYFFSGKHMCNISSSTIPGVSNSYFISLQGVSIALLCKPCTSHRRDVCLSLRLTVCHTMSENDAS